MAGLAIPAAYALFVWWFSTGLIILLDNLPPRTFRYSMAAGTTLFLLALQRLAGLAHDTSLAGAYAAFTFAVLAWGWQEMGFFMGYVTGPRRTGTDPAGPPLRRFWHGVQACLYHELAISLTALVLVASAWHAPNQVGVRTFLLLWAMRQSAKLNFFLGVLNLGEQFLPPHLYYLRSYIARKPMNLLMPLSITAGTALTLVLAQRATAPGLDPANAAGLAFLTTMTALAVLEHWVLVLPLPFDRLWNWALHCTKLATRSRGARHEPRNQLRHELRILLP